MTVISKRLGAVKPSATKAMTAKARELTDGVFSMDGYVANLRDICELAERYGALVMVDDCHAIGHVGEGGVEHRHLRASISGSISSLGRLAKAWVGPWVVSSLRPNRSSISCVKDHAPTSSPTARSSSCGRID